MISDTEKPPVYLSIVIPVYNSSPVVAKTIERTINAARACNWNFELLLINDGSTDNSWDVIKSLSQQHAEVISIDLLKNYGQHTAVYCGIAESSGKFIVTMDDDLQNPPEELEKLVNKIEQGYDLVFARFRQKMHGVFRKMGTRFVGYLNEEIFGKPKEIKLTNFRIFTRQTAERMLQYRTNYPYIPGLLLIHASKMANVETEHHPREIGGSNYTLWRILKLISRLLFNYSSYPLKITSTMGIIISLLSFLAGLFYMLKSLIMGIQVEGWTTLVVLLSFLCGFILVILGIMGEYLARMMNQMAIQDPYIIRQQARP